jgi:phage-related protein
LTTWSFGGTALTDLGRVTILNDYLDAPQRRGENITIPFRHGRTFAQKYYDERVISIGLAISVASATVLESRLDTIKQLASVRTQQTLSQTREDTTIRTTQATLDSPFQISRKTDKFAMAVLDFRMTSPYFRSNTQTLGTVTMSAGTVAGTIVNTGNIEEIDPTITLIGPLNNVAMTNAANGFTLSYAGTIPSGAGGTVTIQTTNGQYVAANDTGTNKIGSVTHTGGAPLMVLEGRGVNGGTNVFTITNSGGTTGKVIFGFYPPYI